MKASGSYANLVQGVSQQVPHQRRVGQCTDQINMIPDPVNGLSRRHGSRWVAEKNLGISPSLLDVLTEDTKNWRTFDYTYNGTEYTLLIRSGSKPVGSTLPSMLVYNKTTSTYLTLVRPVTDAVLDTFESGGAAAYAAVGKYVFFSGNTLTATATSVDAWGDTANQAKAALWIRGGAYARTFTVTATKTDNTSVTFSYKTMTSSYQATLDTSFVPVYAADPAGGTSNDTEAAYIKTVGAFGEADLGWAAWNPTALTAKDGAAVLTNVSPANPASATEYRWDAGAAFVRFHPSLIGQVDVTISYTHTKTVTNPNYPKQVADLTNAYNSAVTSWIGDAAEDIQPDNIAEKLRLAAVAAGLVTAVRYNSHVIFDNVKALVVSDGGDGSLIRGAANEISSIDQVTDYHYVGKVIKVRARSSQEAFYLKATAKDSSVVSGVTEVIWVEGAGVVHTINTGLLYGTAVGNNFYIASTSTLLATLTAGPHPNFKVSTVGDNDTSPLPYFVNRKISFLEVFQDRLLVGAGAVVRASKIGDYLNFFRSSVLTAPADDPFEMLSKGSDDDELRFSVLYDKDLVIFGKKRQYAISGRGPLTPTSANMPTMSTHADAADLPPLSAGGIIFYGKQGERAASVHQIQPGDVAESPESYIASSQVDTYITGRAIELALNAKPACLFLRTDEARNSLFSFHYLDTKAGRKQDAWYRWDFHTDLGPIIGMTPTPNGVMVFTLRSAHGSLWVVSDLCPLTAVLSSRPYFDSQRPYSQVLANTGTVRPSSPGSWQAAFDDSSEWHLLGKPLADAPSLLTSYPSATGLWVGSVTPGVYVPTNPYVRDRNDNAIASGRLVITNLQVSTAESSGFVATVESTSGVVERVFNGRRLGDPQNLIGRVPITDLQELVGIGRETREYVCTLSSLSWLPLTITSIEWTGQFFNRTQRF